MPSKPQKCKVHLVGVLHVCIQQMISVSQLTSILPRDFYQFTVEAVEEDQTSIGVANIYITVEDSNDHPPQFVGGPFAFSIRENVPAGEVIGVVNASDADAGSNEQVRGEPLRGFETIPI